MSSQLAQPASAAFCVVSVYNSPCAGEVGQCRGMFADRLSAVEYVTQHHIDQNLCYGSTDMVLLKQWLNRHLLYLNGESFFEMYGMYDPTIDTFASFQQQIRDNQEGTRFDHWFILSVPANQSTSVKSSSSSSAVKRGRQSIDVPSDDTDSESDEFNTTREETREKKAKLES